MPLRRLLFLFILASSLSPPAVFAQQQASGAITSAQCVKIDTTQQATVGIQVTGTWSGTLNPQISVQGQPATSIQVTPGNSSTAQATITANGFYQAKVAGGSTFLVCGNTVASGTANVYLNASVAVAVVTPPASGSGDVISSPAAQLAFYPATAAQVQGTSHVTDDGTTIAVTASGGLNVNTGGGGGSPITSTGFGTLAALAAATSGIGFGSGGVIQGNINAGGWFPMLLASTNTLGNNTLSLNWNDLTGPTEIFNISTTSGPGRLVLCGTAGPQSFWIVGHLVPCPSISTNPQANFNIETASGSALHTGLRIYAGSASYASNMIALRSVTAAGSGFNFFHACAGATGGDTECGAGTVVATLDGTGFYTGSGLNMGGLDTLTANTLSFSGSSGLSLLGPVVSTTNTASILKATSAVAQYFALKNTTAAIVGASQFSPLSAVCGRGFHGSADEEECATWQILPGNGNDAAGTIAIAHTGTGTGVYTFTTPGPVKSGSTSNAGELDLPGNTAVGAVVANTFSHYGPNSASFSGIGIQWPTTLTAGAFVRVGTAASGVSPATADFSDFTFPGAETAAATTPFVIQNTNSTNNNASVAAIINGVGTSTGQEALIVNNSSSSTGHIVDFTTGGTVTAGAISGQTIRASIASGGTIVSGGTMQSNTYNNITNTTNLSLIGTNGTTNGALGQVIISGGNNSSTGASAAAGAIAMNAGDLTGAITNGVGKGVTIRPGLGTGNAKSNPIILGSQTFSTTSGTTAQTNVGALIPAYKVAGSTTTATATNLFNVAIANNQTVAVKVIVHVETTQATPHNCSTTEEFVATAQETSGTVTQQTTAGTIATICDTGTLTLAAALSTAAPTVFSVTPSWTTIVPSGVIITVEIHNLSQQDIALL